MFGMSRALQKHNTMLLRCTYAQFCGFCVFAGIPAIIIVLIYYFISEPCKLIYFCFLLMNMFGLFDILVTVICIKPYRIFFMDLFRFEHCTKVSPQTRYRLKSININILH
uniref:G-protein coupled receptors family 1 profile domain-containing protein n=1 Tax=Panagrolaimus sp. PS1159 TaxID=55785 RepID=A0AC35GRK0_9BILA